jgi:hypothetical protein
MKGEAFSCGGGAVSRWELSGTGHAVRGCAAGLGARLTSLPAPKPRQQRELRRWMMS